MPIDQFVVSEVEARSPTFRFGGAGGDGQLLASGRLSASSRDPGSAWRPSPTPPCASSSSTSSCTVSSPPRRVCSTICCSFAASTVSSPSWRCTTRCAARRDSRLSPTLRRSATARAAPRLPDPALLPSPRRVSLHEALRPEKGARVSHPLLPLHGVRHHPRPRRRRARRRWVGKVPVEHPRARRRRHVRHRPYRRGRIVHLPRRFRPCPPLHRHGSRSRSSSSSTFSSTSASPSGVSSCTPRRSRLRSSPWAPLSSSFRASSSSCGEIDLSCTSEELADDRVLAVELAHPIVEHIQLFGGEVGDVRGHVVRI